MTNYIFVDFDGPLLSGRCHLFPENRKAAAEFLKGGNPIPYFDPVAMRMHNLWAKYGNAKVVFSTSWARTFRGDWDECEAYLKRVMVENGFEGEFADYCITPKRRSSEHIHEIQEWCFDNLKEGDKFIAVDDANLSFLEHEQCSWKNQGKWIRVDYNDGLTWRNFKDGCEFLGVNNDELLLKEFGIVPRTEEERKRDRELISLLGY
jgi:hypothetical protein